MTRPTTLSAGTHVKWQLFRLLERMSEMRSGSAGRDGSHTDHAAASAPDTNAAPEARSLWVFVSTIGELNAIEPFLNRLLTEMGAPPLVLLTDHPHYRESFLAKYPAARVCALDHRSQTVATLVEALPPRALVMAEIPCMLSDAPCRFPFAVLYELKRRSIPVCVINGWLYRQAPSCAMDAIEKRLFGREYLQLFDLMTVQDDITRTTLVAEGADSQRVFVTGNIKFDAVNALSWDPARSRSPVLLRSITEGARPVVVAGCVTNISEQTLVLDAFAVASRVLPNALLVLAPRHPEVKERMEKLRNLLTERKLNYALKSETGDVPVADDLDCLVLDTMGELKDFYAAGTIAYVGLNHNILEPMAFGKPVVVTPGWEPAYPSFPVYRHLLAGSAIKEVENRDLGEAWLGLLCDPSARSAKREEISRMLESLKGATARNAELLARFGLLQSLRTVAASRSENRFEATDKSRF